MRFLVDAQLPPAPARWLASEDYKAEHVVDCGLADTGDTAIWAYAKVNSATIVTKDEDFALLQTLKPGEPAVVWLRLGNTRKATLLAWLHPLLPDIVAALDLGETLVEVS